MTIPDECFDRTIEVVHRVTLESFKRVKRYDRRPRPLKPAAQQSMAEDLLTVLDWAARRYYGFGVEEVVQ